MSGSESDATGDTYAALFHSQFRAMVRLAALLGAEDPEDVAQEAFCRLHPRMRRLRDQNAAIGYLRTTVVNLTRSGHRHLGVVRRRTPPPMPAPTPVEELVELREEYAAVVTAMRSVSPRHREALVLRYWSDLSQAEMAQAMTCTTGTVKSHVSRGLSALSALLIDVQETPRVVREQERR